MLITKMLNYICWIKKWEKENNKLFDFLATPF